MNNNIFCFFCKRNKNQVLCLINNNNIYICNYCIKNFYKKYKNEYIEKDVINNNKNFILKLKNKIKYPKNIKKFLDYYIIGQENTKKIISVSIYNHLKRLLYYYNNINKKENIEIDKSNILMIGDTGTGKTLIAKTISKILKLPFVIVDATVFTEAGYVGEDVESILTRLLQISNYNINLTEIGIVYIDEFDKLSRKSSNPSITRDVSGEGVQQSLLKLFENSTIYISPFIGRKHPEQNMIPIKTNNILFIVGGSFEGINNIIKNRMNINNNIKIGYNKVKKKIYKNKNYLKYITIKDLHKFGIIPEIIGRLPIITYLNKLDKKNLKKIMIEPKNALIKQYIELFKIDNIEIIIDNSFIDIIVNKAIKLGLGARGLKHICEKIFIEITFNIKKNKKIKLNKNKIYKILKKI
ncbi:MAG: ATP-dependent Clp protease ATP-binding subunit ClpX [Candidatus Shikimatogenerans bostrichidophilus]|nr:MAG: ATP-dependent Clp protease ATP-binding subunit ClpX [Candidatus Shikimatogenerans bostrichidophilus]